MSTGRELVSSLVVRQLVVLEEQQPLGHLQPVAQNILKRYSMPKQSQLQRQRLMTIPSMSRRLTLLLIIQFLTLGLIESYPVLNYPSKLRPGYYMVTYGQFSV